MASEGVKRPQDFLRFREMVGRQTDELNSAIRQRTEYESRLAKAEEELKAERQRSDALLLELDGLRKKSSLGEVLETSTSMSQISLTNSFADNPSYRSSVEGELFSREASNRASILASYWELVAGQVNDAYLTLRTQTVVELRLKEARATITGLNFQLRVAAPIKFRNAVLRQQAAEAELFDTRDEMDQLQHRLDALLLDASKLRDAKEELERSLDVLHGRNEDLDRELAAVRSSRRLESDFEDKHADRVAALENEVERMREDAEELQRQLDSSVGEADMLHRSNASLRQEIESLSQQLRESERHRQESQSHEKRQADVQAEKRIRELEGQLRIAFTREKALMEDIEERSERLKKATSEKASLEEQLESLQLESLEQSRQLTDENTHMQSELRTIRSVYSALEVENTTLRHEYDVIQKKLEEEIQQRTKSGMEYLSGMKSAEQATRAFQEKQVQDLLLELQSTKHDCQVALSAKDREHAEVVSELQNQVATLIDNESRSRMAAATELQNLIAQHDAERQRLEAEKASIVAAHREDMAQLEGSLAQSQLEVDRANRQLRQIQVRLDEAQRDYQQREQRLDQRVANLESQRAEVLVQKESVEATLRAEKGKSHEVMVKLMDRESEVAALAVKVSALEGRLRSSEDECVRVQNDNARLLQNLRSIEFDRESKHTSELQDILDSELQLRKERSTLQMEVQRLSEKLEGVELTVESQRRRAQEQERHVAESAEGIASLTQQLDAAAAARRKLERDLAKAEAELNDVRQQSASSHELVQLSQQAKAALTDELLKLRDACQSQSKEIQVLVAELARKNVMVEQLMDEGQKHSEELKEKAELIARLQRNHDAQQEVLVEVTAENDSFREIMDETVAAVEAEVRALNLELKSMQFDKQANQEALLRKEKEVIRLEHTIEELKQSCAQLEDRERARAVEWESKCQQLQAFANELQHELAQKSLQWAEDKRMVTESFSIHVDKIHDDVAQQRQENSILRSRVHDSEAKILLMEAQIDLLTATLDATNESTSDVHTAMIAVIREKESRCQRLIEAYESSQQEALQNAEYVARKMVEYSTMEVMLADLTTALQEMQCGLKDLHETRVTQERSMSTQKEEEIRAVEELYDSELQLAAARLAAVEQALANQGDHNTTLMNDIKILSQERDRLATELEFSKAHFDKSLQSVGTRHEAYEATIQQLEAELVQRERVIVKLRDEGRRSLESLELERATALAEEKGLRDEMDRLESAYKKQLDGVNERLDAEKRRREAFEAQLEAVAHVRSEQDRIQLEACQAEVARQQIMIEELTRRRNDAELQLNEVNHQCGLLLADNKRLDGSLAHRDEDLAAALQQASEASDKAIGLSKRVLELERTVATLRQELEAREAAITILKEAEASNKLRASELQHTADLRWQSKVEAERCSAQQGLQFLYNSLLFDVQNEETHERLRLEHLYDSCDVVGLSARLLSSCAWHDYDRYQAVINGQQGVAESQLRLKQVRHAASAVTSLMKLQVEECDARVGLLADLSVSEGRYIATGFAVTIMRSNARTQRENRSNQARVALLTEDAEKNAKKLVEMQETVARMEREASMEKANGESFVRINEERSVQIAELEEKRRVAEATLEQEREGKVAALSLVTAIIHDSERKCRQMMQQSMLLFCSDVQGHVQGIMLGVAAEHSRLSSIAERAEHMISYEISTVQRTLNDRIAKAQEEASLQKTVNQLQIILHAEAMQRSALYSASQLLYNEFWREALHSHGSVLTMQFDRNLRDLRHALVVSQKESILIKQKATALVEVEAQSCAATIKRLQRRRLNDLAWIPDGSPLFSPPRATQVTIALETVEELEHQSRLLLVKFAVDALHSLHLCLLIA